MRRPQTLDTTLSEDEQSPEAWLCMEEPYG
jgi:hypothetical protein